MSLWTERAPCKRAKLTFRYCPPESLSEGSSGFCGLVRGWWKLTLPAWHTPQIPTSWACEWVLKFSELSLPWAKAFLGPNRMPWVLWGESYQAPYTLACQAVWAREMARGRWERRQTHWRQIFGQASYALSALISSSVKQEIRTSFPGYWEDRRNHLHQVTKPGSETLQGPYRWFPFCSWLPWHKLSR